MERPLKGDLVTMPYPYLDGIRVKNRPALVIATPDINHAILCQITSAADSKRFGLTIHPNDFEIGQLRKISQVRVDVIFSFEVKLISKIVGHVTPNFFDRVIEKLNEMIHQS